MGVYPPSLARLIEQLSKLPGIGKKSAERLALHVLRSPKELAEGLAQSLLDVKEKIRFCSVCFNLADTDPCPICTDQRRENGMLCVVEGPGDQLAIEKSGAFQGRYHVLQGVLSPLDGIGVEDLRVSELMSRLKTENIKEIILALNPTVLRGHFNEEIVQAFASEPLSIFESMPLVQKLVIARVAHDQTGSGVPVSA